MVSRETQVKDVWKFCTTELGAQFVMTVSLTLRQRSLVMHSASGMLSMDFSSIHINSSLIVISNTSGFVPLTCTIF